MFLGALRDRLCRSRRHRRSLVLVFLAACPSGCAEADEDAGCSESAAVLSPELYRLVSLGGGLSLAGVSSDGTVVVGSMYDSDRQQAFRWTELPGVIPLGFVAGYDHTKAVAVSGDGTAVVGTAMLGVFIKQEPFRWTEPGGMVGLGFGTSQHDQGWTTAVSRDGSVVVGGLRNSRPGAPADEVAFRWTESSGMVALELPPGAHGATATNVSADGSTVVGHAFTGNTWNARVFRWTESTGTVSLDAPADATTTASFVSDDGSVIAGVAGAEGAAVAFRWTERTGFVGLGPLPGVSRSRPTGMTADGAVVVGVSGNGGLPRPVSNRAFRWTEASGLMALELLPRAAPYQWNGAIAVSSNGSTVLGSDDFWTGSNTTGWESDIVMWNARGCATRVRPVWDTSESAGIPQAVSGDGRTIIGAAGWEQRAIGWVARLR